MHNGTLLTPFPMSEAEKAVVEECFTRMLGHPVTLMMQVDHTLLGGIRVTVDGCMYDGSLRSRLDNVKRLLETGEEGERHA